MNSDNDVRIEKLRPIMALEELSDEEIMALFTRLVPDMSDNMKISLHKEGYLDLHYSYMWTEGKELTEKFWYLCSEKIIQAAATADDLEAIYNEVITEFRLPRCLFQHMLDKLIAIVRITKVSHLLNR